MTSDVSNYHSDYTRRQIQWARIRDALEGSDEIKEQGEAYLPKPDGMTQDAYKAYKARAHFFPVSERTLRGLSGLVFRNAATYALPKRLEPLREAATTEGYSLELLAEQIANEVLSVGRYGLLLDFPTTATTVNSVPYIATYTAENITDWKVQLVNGLRCVTRLVLCDDFDGDEDTSTASAEQRLELIINDDGNYEMRRWLSSRAQKNTGSQSAWIMTGSNVPLVNGKPLKKIPFVFVNPYDMRPEVEKPPMLDLVDVNLGLYRNSADYEYSLFLTSQPTPWVSGAINEGNKPTAIGPGAFWVLPEGAQAGMLEFSGQGIQAMERAMESKKNELAALGARMIHEGQNRNEASDTARMRGRSELSLLTNVVNMVQGALEKTLRMAAEWVNGNPDEVEVTLNRDWVDTRMNGTDLTAIVKAWQSGAISHPTLFENLQRGEIVPSHRTFDEEKDLIEEEGGDIGLGINEALMEAAKQPPGSKQAGAASTPEPDTERETGIA